MNVLTIILASYNRKELLRRAIESCRNQLSREFDLVIFDDLSTDGAREYLQSIRQDPLISSLILNETNLGFSASVNAALHVVKTEWATILCDDDYLTPDFVAASQTTLQYTDKDCVITSFNHVDMNGNVLQSFPQQRCSVNADQALAKDIPVAGISGFFFRLGSREDRALMHDYPRAFFSDTFFVTEFILSRGLETVEEAYYNKTVWDQSESALDAQSARQFFEAMLLFRRDLRPALERHNTPKNIQDRLLRPMSLMHFSRVLLLPILARGALTRQDVAKWYALARHYDSNFMPHCRLLALTSILANRHTLGLRGQAHRAYRRWVAQRPMT